MDDFTVKGRLQRGHRFPAEFPHSIIRNGAGARKFE